MVARNVKIARRYEAPNVATAIDYIITGKTQGPCDYLTFDLWTYATEQNAGIPTDTGLLNGVDRVEVTVDSSGDPTQGDTGSVFYTFYGGAAVVDSAVTMGMLSTVQRMLFKCQPFLVGKGTWAKSSSNAVGVVMRLPLGKNNPVQVSVHVYLAATAAWTATGTVNYANVTMELFAHLVDSVADLKVKQTTKTGFGPSAESELLDIPDAPGYWFVGWSLDIRPTAGTSYVDRLGGGLPTDDVVTANGWARVSNSDGQIFDWATGQILKADMTAMAGPCHLYAAADLYSEKIYEVGQYFRLMPAPIEAKSLKLQVFPNAAGVATDIYRIWYFYSKQGTAIKQTNAQQPQTTNFGAAGATMAQDSKK